MTKETPAIARRGFFLGTVLNFLSLFFVAPLFFLILVISSRIVYELAIVVFRISDQTADIARNTAEIARRAERHPADPPPQRPSNAGI